MGVGVPPEGVALRRARSPACQDLSARVVGPGAGRSPVLGHIRGSAPCPGGSPGVSWRQWCPPGAREVPAVCRRLPTDLAVAGGCGGHAGNCGGPPLLGRSAESGFLQHPFDRVPDASKGGSNPLATRCQGASSSWVKWVARAVCDQDCGHRLDDELSDLSFSQHLSTSTPLT